MLVGSICVAGTKELWKVCTPPKVKYFFWLALHGQHWTANTRWQHNLQDSDSCALCDQVSETGSPADGLCSQSGSLVLSATLPRLGGVNPLFDKMFDWWLGSRKLVPKLSRRDFGVLAPLERM